MSKRYKAFRFSVIALFVIFLTLYFSQITGYYEYQNFQKMTMTKEQIEQFEQDVKDGKPVDIKDYVVDNKQEYKNGFSNIGYTLSSNVSELVKNGVIKLFGSISGYVNE